MNLACISKTNVTITTTFQDKLDETAFKMLADYHSGTVSILALMAAATGDVSYSCPYDMIICF